MATLSSSTSWQDQDPLSPAHLNSKMDPVISNISVLNASVVSTALLFNVKNYGAVGDGTTDDTSSINSAIDAAEGASSQGGGVVYFPAGVYLTTSTLTISGTRTSMLGDGWLSSTISSAHSYPVIDVNASGFGMWRMGVTGSEYTLNSSRNSQNVGVWYRTNTSKPTLDHVYITSTGSYCVFFEANAGSGGMFSNLFLSASLDTEAVPRFAAAIGQRGQDSVGVPRHFTNLDTSGNVVFDLDGVNVMLFTNVFGHNFSMTSRTARVKVQTFRLGTSNTSTIVRGTDMEFVGDHNGHWYIDPTATKILINGSTVSGVVDGRSTNSDLMMYSTEDNDYGGSKVAAHRVVSGTSATTLAPSFGFRSEESLGLFRSGSSTMAVSYGTFSLNQARLTSVRTVASLASSGNGVNTELWFTVGVSVTTLNFRSGNTTYLWASSANTTV